jgi:hypothetical protein
LNLCRHLVKQGPCRFEEVFPKRKVGVRRAHCTLHSEAEG